MNIHIYSESEIVQAEVSYRIDKFFCLARRLNKPKIHALDHYNSF